MFKDIFLSYPCEERKELINELLKWSSTINEPDNLIHLFQNYMNDIVSINDNEDKLKSYKWFRFDYLKNSLIFQRLVENELKTNGI